MIKEDNFILVDKEELTKLLFVFKALVLIVADTDQDLVEALKLVLQDVNALLAKVAKKE